MTNEQQKQLLKILYRLSNATNLCIYGYSEKIDEEIKKLEQIYESEEQ